MADTSLENGTSSQEDFVVDLDAIENTPVVEPDNKSVEPSTQPASTEPVQPATGEDGNIVLTDSEGNVENTLEIDERFKGLPAEEGIVRTLQSRYDTLDATHNKLVKELEVYQQEAELFRSLSEDEGLLMAFLNEVKPDLVQGRDVGSSIKEKLKAEFGEDYTPTLSRDEAERTDPGGTDWKYYKRLDALANELTGDTEHPQTIKEYLEKRKQQVESEEAEYREAIEKTKLELKMTDEEVKAVSDWGIGLSFKELVRVHRFLRRFPTRNPNIVHAPGSGPKVESERERFIKETMGK